MFFFAEFQDLFPSRNLLQQNLTAITISQQTHNDMSVWNSNVEQEREELLQQVRCFIKMGAIQL